MIINTNTQIDWAPIVEGTLSEYYNSRITTLANYAFYNYSNLQKVSFPNCNYIGSYAFYGCSNLQTVNFPNCSSIGASAFRSCFNLQTISFPICSYISINAFYGCSNLQTVSFPNCRSIGAYAFRGCSNLQKVSFPNCNYIGSYAFGYCYNLISLYLMSASVVSLPYSIAFSSTPIGGYSASAGRYGSIYVPASLFNTYKSATNWSYFSSRFVSV